jgi:putative ABC transport system permease protein
VYLAARDLLATKARFTLVGVVIGLIAFLATMLAGLANGLVDDGISGLRALPLTHLAFQQNAQSVFSRSILGPDDLAAYRGTDGVEATPIGVSFFNARPADGGGDTVDIALFGVEEGGFLAESSKAARAGAAPSGSLDGGLVLSSELRDRARIGEELHIVGTDLTLPVVGFTFAGTYGHVPIAYTSLATWQELLYGDGADGRFSAVALRSTDDDTLHALADSAAGVGAGTEVLTRSEAYVGSPGFSAESATMTLIRGFLLVISALVVGAFFTVWTIQRTRQIGLLKALGASSAYVVRDALGQLLAVLLVAIAAGAGAAAGVGALVGDDAPFSLTVGAVAGTAAVLVVVGMAGSLVALRRVTSVDPAISLTAGV